MTNHPNRTAAYKVSVVNGRFDHVLTKRAAVARAIEIVGAPANTSAETLSREWGVTITRITPAAARAVGLEPADAS